MKPPARATRSAASTLPMNLGLLGVLLILLSMGFAVHAAGQQQGQASAPAVAPATPNYTLAARFVPSQVSKLVFDTSVTPHWFELSDRFWYSYETAEGTQYWVVDPIRRLKIPLFDNAKLAAQLSTLTNFPYDAQHLPIKNLKLVKNDTALQFDVEVFKDAVIPNEPKKAEDTEETIQEGNEQRNQTQQTTQRQQNEQTGAAGEKPEAKPKTRKIYFEYELATGKLTRLDGFEAPPPKPMWASISPDEKTRAAPMRRWSGRTYGSSGIFSLMNRPFRNTP